MAWKRTIEAHGVRVRLYQRGSAIWSAVTVGRTVSKSGRSRAEEVRRSFGHSDRKLAELQAKELARTIAESRLTGLKLGRLSLGQIFAAYDRYKAPSLSGEWRRAAKTRMAMFEAAWGRDLDVGDLSQTHVDTYVSKRRNCEVVPPSLRRPPDDDGRPGQGWRKPRPVRDGTLDADFRWLSSVFNWARRHKVNGSRLLIENPLHDCKLPKERNPRRPVASHHRYVATLEHADESDPQGRLRCILALARYSGRREGAICQLRLTDLLLSQDGIRRALAAEGMDERLAEHMPHGAIRWSPETDKQGLLFVTPINRQAREELDRYLSRSPRVGDVPLFTAPRDPAEPIRRDTAAHFLLRAERMAGLPKLEGGVFHPYRRLWASERKHLPDVDVASAGGWKDTRALKLSYQHADPATVLAVVEHTA